MSDSAPLAGLARDLEAIFGSRLRSLLGYGARERAPKGPVQALALVEHVTADDLRACSARVQGWHRQGLATPLVLSAGEFRRSLDVFPFEFGAILDDYEIVRGPDPFHGLAVDPDDLRRACEVQLRSHLLHLREAFIETRGRGQAIAELIVRSAAPLAALLRHIARLDHTAPVNGVLPRVAQLRQGMTLPNTEAERLFPEYLHALERLTHAIDHWERA